MRCAHEGIFLKTLPLKLTKTLNALIFVSSFLNFVEKAALRFLLIMLDYIKSAPLNK